MLRKRLLDLALTIPVLLLLLPVYLAVCLAVKLSSPGPVLFRQERVGRGGRLFTILKFRSMVANASELGPAVTASLDPRITGVGRFLRKTKLDELPQLWNVLVGEMSLVGPRPEVPEYVAHYPPHLKDKVLSVPPGITADAAIEFLDEEEALRSVDDPHTHYIEQVLPRKLELYERYVDQWTLRSDLKTLFRTFLAMLRIQGNKA